MSESNPFEGSRIVAFVADVLGAIERSESPIDEVKNAIAMINDQVAAADVRLEALRWRLRAQYGAELGLTSEKIEQAARFFSASLMEEMIASRVADGETLGEVMHDVSVQAHVHANGDGRRH